MKTVYVSNSKKLSDALAKLDQAGKTINKDFHVWIDGEQTIVTTGKDMPEDV